MWKMEKFGSRVIVSHEKRDYSISVQIYSHIRYGNPDERLSKEMELGREIAEKLNKAEGAILDKS